MEIENKSKKNLGIFTGIIVVLGVILATIFLGKKNSDTSVTNSPQTTTPTTVVNTPTPPIDIPKKAVSIYKDGTYSATGSYMSPGGLDRLAVTLTLKNDLVTSVSIVPEPGDNTSARYQEKFASGYKQYVLGKNIADVNLTKVSGSSLTPKGFDDALAQIKIQAKV